MIISIQQPEHLPWIGFFNKMAQCDKFVLLDHVQFKKNYFENRNRIKTANGPMWLTVPVKLTGRFGQTMREVEVADNSVWITKYLKTIEQTYGRAPYFKDVRETVFPVFETEPKMLFDINRGLIEALAAYLEINTERLFSSTMQLGDARKADLILEICKNAGAKTYISGPDGRNYLNLGHFQDAGIKVVYHDFTHPVYPQRNGDFASHMSVIDLIANSGPDSRNIVRDCYRFSQ